MSQRPLTIPADEVLLRALQARAAREGVSPGEVVTALLRQALAPEIEEARGLAPLADVIQEHHDRRQTPRRSTRRYPKSPDR
jgi:hypothetical protein